MKGAEAESSWKMNLNRQLAEVEVIRSIYGGEGEFEMNSLEEAFLEALSSLDMSLKKSNENTGKSSGKIDGSISGVHKLLHIKRVVIWFHHIKSLQKRKSILEWGRELNLGGYCKPGFPGIIIVEGEKCDVDTYVKQLQNLRWQAVSVRGEEQEEVKCGEEIDNARRFLKGVKELDEHGMSELGRLCREANLEHLFLSALKINR